MSLLLVRHAQASYGAANYDQLSPMGWEQAGHLGRYLAASPHRFAQVRVGAMRRHRETLSAIQQGFADADIAMPAAEEDSDLNEFDHEAVIRAYLQQRADAGMRERAASKDLRIVGPMLLAALSAWAAGELESIPEPWAVFGDRVARAGQSAADAGREGEVLVVSSGGVISRLAQQALDVPPPRAVELNLAIRNASINEFSPSHGRLRLGSFNTLPHLAAHRALWTHF